MRAEFGSCGQARSLQPSAATSLPFDRRQSPAVAGSTTSRDYYEVLGVSRDADKDQIDEGRALGVAARVSPLCNRVPKEEICPMSPRRRK
jgi:hypothetical protein